MENNYLIYKYVLKELQFRRIFAEIMRRYKQDNEGNPYLRVEPNLFQDSNTPERYVNVRKWLNRYYWAYEAKCNAMSRLWHQMNGYERTYIAYHKLY